MEQKAGAQISQRAFHSVAGDFICVDDDRGDPDPGHSRRSVCPHRRSMDARRSIPIPSNSCRNRIIPIWRWFIAPVEVLGSSSGLTIIVIIVVLFFAGGAFAVMDKTGTLRAFIGRIVRRFRDRKYALLWVVSLAFMFLGATLGTFEEVVLLVPCDDRALLLPWLGRAGRAGHVHPGDEYGILCRHLQSVYAGCVAATGGLAFILRRVVSHHHLHCHLSDLCLVSLRLRAQNRSRSESLSRPWRRPAPSAKSIKIWMRISFMRRSQGKIVP